MTLLNSSNLATIEKSVPVPTYDREQVRTGIVHIGVGGFHRAHEAMYVDTLMERGEGLDWGITRSRSAPRRPSHGRGDGEAGLSLHPRPEAPGRLTGAARDRLAGRLPVRAQQTEEVLRLMTEPSTRIVSLTITEGGYHVNQATGDFDADAPDIQRDLAPGAVPSTAFGLLTEALARRRAADIPVHSDVLRQHPGQRGRDASDARVLRRVEGPRPGRVDSSERQLPGLDGGPHRAGHHRYRPRRAGAALRHRGRLAGRVRTVGAMGAGRRRSQRPRLEQVGVQLVDDVEPYELMKLRLLNASHQAMCYLGYLAGYRYAHEVCADPLFVDFLTGYLDEEATPTLPPVPGVDLDDYKQQLIVRFANPEVRDTSRGSAPSSDRIPKWLLPVIRAQLARVGEIGARSWWSRPGRATRGHRREGAADRDRRRRGRTAGPERSEDPLAFCAIPASSVTWWTNHDSPRPTLEALRMLHDQGARAP